MKISKINTFKASHNFVKFTAFELKFDSSVFLNKNSL